MLTPLEALGCHLEDPRIPQEYDVEAAPSSKASIRGRTFETCVAGCLTSHITTSESDRTIHNPSRQPRRSPTYHPPNNSPLIRPIPFPLPIKEVRPIHIRHPPITRMHHEKRDATLQHQRVRSRTIDPLIPLHRNPMLGVQRRDRRRQIKTQHQQCAKVLAMGDFQRRFGQAGCEVGGAGGYCELVEEVFVGFLRGEERGAAVRAGGSLGVVETR
jgi:hypothetical protein